MSVLAEKTGPGPEGPGLNNNTLTERLGSPGPGVNQTSGRTRGIGGCPRLHRGLYVGRRMMQRGEHQDGADRQADRDGQSKRMIGSTGVLSSTLRCRIGAGCAEEPTR